MVILRQPSRPRALLLLLPFQFCFVAIIKEARALSNKSLRFARRRTQMAPPHLCQLLGKRTHTRLTYRGIEGVSEFRKLWGKKGISSSTFVHHVDFRDEGAFSSYCFVSEVFDHDILGTSLDQFHDSARLPASPFVDDSRLLGR